MRERAAIGTITLALVLGCPAPQEPEPSTPPSRVIEVARVADPDPAALQSRLDAVAEIPTHVLGRAPIPTPGPPYRDIVVFKVSGRHYCKLGATAPTQCRDNSSVPWSTLELLGLAVVSFHDPTLISVDRVRFLGRGGWSTASEPPGGMPTRRLTNAEMLVDTTLVEVVVDDVDDDGRDEFVVRFGYSELQSDLGGFEISSHHERLLVVRDDLSLQAGVKLHQEWRNLESDASGLVDVLNGNYAFAGEDGALVLEGCEVAGGLRERCETVDMLCEPPTYRRRARYDPHVDGYEKIVYTELRPRIEGDPRCPP